MKIEFGKSWEKKIKGRIEAYRFEVGILDDSAHLNPVEAKLFGQPQLTTYASGPVRKTSRNAGDKTTGEVLIDNMKRMNRNILLEPFQERSSDIIKFTQAFLKMVTTAPGMNIRRVENLLQAVVRNPILRKDYGDNNATTADSKGFNRRLIDTGQMFKAIIAKAKRV